jgi:hypothetical protein
MQTVLGSWKEIANYLGKGVRTVQRWERESALPVHRPATSRKGLVLAFPGELDAWVRHQPAVSHDEGKVAARENRVLLRELVTQSAALRASMMQLVAKCERAVQLGERIQRKNGHSRVA